MAAIFSAVGGSRLASTMTSYPPGRSPSIAALRPGAPPPGRPPSSPNSRVSRDLALVYNRPHTGSSAIVSLAPPSRRIETTDDSHDLGGSELTHPALRLQ